MGGSFGEAFADAAFLGALLGAGGTLFAVWAGTAWICKPPDRVTRFYRRGNPFFG